MAGCDHEIDNAIISHLFECEKANFSQLLGQVQRLRSRISKKVLSSHLKKLEEDNIIRRDKEKPGVARYSYLTNQTRQQINLGVPVHIRSKREHRASALYRGDADELAARRKKAYIICYSSMHRQEQAA